MQLFAPPRPRQEWVQDPQAECGLDFVSSLSLATGHHHRAATPQDLVLDLICALLIFFAHSSFQPDLCFRSHFQHFFRFALSCACHIVVIVIVIIRLLVSTSASLDVVFLARLGQYFRMGLHDDFSSGSVAIRDFVALFTPLWLQW